MPIGTFIWVHEGCVSNTRRPLCKQSDSDANDYGNDDNNENNEEQAPPLLSVASTRANDSCANLLITFCDVFADFVALLHNVGDENLLLLDDLVEILEELSKLDHLALDVLDGFVALLHIAKSRACLTAAVRAQELGEKLANEVSLMRKGIHTACWKMGASVSETASLTSASVASGRTMRYWRSAACCQSPLKSDSST
jgi:hypothetical protein